MDRAWDALEILIEAKQKIADPSNWGKGGRRDRFNFNSCCVAEAIEEAGPVFGVSAERRRAFRAFRNAGGIEDVWGLFIQWNDAPERTHAEVMAAFNLAIATLRLS